MSALRPKSGHAQRQHRCLLCAISGHRDGLTVWRNGPVLARCSEGGRLGSLPHGQWHRWVRSLFQARLAPSSDEGLTTRHLIALWRTAECQKANPVNETQAGARGYRLRGANSFHRAHVQPSSETSLIGFRRMSSASRRLLDLDLPARCRYPALAQSAA
jgi:hypothetical protein